MTNSALSGNTAGAAGGSIYSSGGALTITNSTISGNTSATIDGGVFLTGTLILTNSTISGNTGSRGGGFYNSGTVKLVNTIIAKNTASRGPDCFGAPTSLGHNFVGHPVGCDFAAEPSDVVGTVDFALDPKPGPLQDNGGATQTHGAFEF